MQNVSGGDVFGQIQVNNTTGAEQINLGATDASAGISAAINIPVSGISTGVGFSVQGNWTLPDGITIGFSITVGSGGIQSGAVQLSIPLK
jgi:hypothetical protein